MLPAYSSGDGGEVITAGGHCSAIGGGRDGTVSGNDDWPAGGPIPPYEIFLPGLDDMLIRIITCSIQVLYEKISAKIDRE